MRIASAIALLLLSLSAHASVFSSGGPATTNNDDSCDIALLPAATLLLPYFEVDLTALPGEGETTLFSVTNLSVREQIAHVTLWTDYAYPVLAFDIYLTGYDVQSINLYDVIKLGRIGSLRGTGTSVSPLGDFSRRNEELDRVSCQTVPGRIAAHYLTRLQQALTHGAAPSADPLPACGNIGFAHANAIGYATIDVVRSCNTLLTPADPEYYAGTLRFDNVLMGDSIQMNGGSDRAEGSPMVHIRAIPEGGGTVNFPRTFYGRFQSGANRVADGRQPLPSTFAARWIEGGPGSFETSLKIWREGVAGPNAACADYRLDNHPIAESVTVDEDENAVAVAPPCGGPSPCIPMVVTFPATGSYEVGEGMFPEFDPAPLGGWMYLNLDNPATPGATQGWVVTSMRAEGRFSLDAAVVALGNGCSPPALVTEVTGDSTTAIGPAANVNP